MCDMKIFKKNPSGKKNGGKGKDEQIENELVTYFRKLSGVIVV